MFAFDVRHHRDGKRFEFIDFFLSRCRNSQGDEWNEFVEEGAKDYTGLKIGNLQLNDDGFTETDADGDENADSEDPEHKGPWQKQQADGQESAAPATSSNVEKSKAGLGSSTGAYVIPADRQSRHVNVKRGKLPDLNNEENFPSLGGAKAEELRRKRNEPGFEDVKHGGRYQQSSDLDKNAPVSVENPFNLLSDS